MENQLYSLSRSVYYQFLNKVSFYKKRRLLKGKIAYDLKPQELDCFELLQSIDNDSHKITCIYDIGAAVGTFSILAQAFFPDAVIHAFEPLSNQFSELENNTNNIENIILHKIGLGSENKTTDIYLTSQSDSSSILNPSEGQLKKYWDISVVETQKIELHRLDDYIDNKRNLLKIPELIKIDVQGYELEALKGGIKCLKQVEWIIIEVSFEQLYQDQPIFHEIINFMANNKFYLFSLGQNTPTGIHKLIQINCLFKKIH